jgi:Uma2 family endonuclease
VTENPPAIHLNPDDLLRMPDGDSYELVKGTPVEKKPMGARASETTIALAILLGAFIRQNQLGHLYDGQTGFHCFPDDPDRVRKPDLAFVATGRLPGERSPDGFIRLAPDLAVEVVSPNDLVSEVDSKVIEYLGAGVRLVWVVNPTVKTILVRRADGSAAVLTESDTLSGEAVVPGFACRVGELFA